MYVPLPVGDSGPAYQWLWAYSRVKSALDWSRRFRRTHGRDQHTDRQPGRPRNVGIGAFADAAPHIWNTLPTDVVAANPLVVHLPTTVETFFVLAIAS